MSTKQLLNRFIPMPRQIFQSIFLNIPDQRKGKFLKYCDWINTANSVTGVINVGTTAVVAAAAPVTSCILCVNVGISAFSSTLRQHQVMKSTFNKSCLGTPKRDQFILSCGLTVDAGLTGSATTGCVLGVPSVLNASSATTLTLTGVASPCLFIAAGLCLLKCFQTLIFILRFICRIQDMKRLRRESIYNNNDDTKKASITGGDKYTNQLNSLYKSVYKKAAIYGSAQCLGWLLLGAAFLLIGFLIIGAIAINPFSLLAVAGCLVFGIILVNRYQIAMTDTSFNFTKISNAI